MSFLNGLYLFVESEDYSANMNISTHSVEKGVPFTDTVRRNPIEVSISGEIIDYSVGEKEHKAAKILSQIEAIKNAGTLVTYNGRRALTSMQIRDFSTGHNGEVMGGCTFNMTLVEFRSVSNAYVAPKNNAVKDGGNQQVEKGDNEEVYYTVKKGDCVAALVANSNAPYKNLKREGAESGYWGACNWVMQKNEHAFSRKGDFGTLKVNAKLLVGTR